MPVQAAPGPPPIFQPWFHPAARGPAAFIRSSLPLSQSNLSLTLPAGGLWLCSLLLRGPFLGARSRGRQGGLGSRLQGHVPKGLGLHHPWGEGAVRGGQSGISEMQGWGRDSLPSFKEHQNPSISISKGDTLGLPFVSLLSPMFVTSWMMPTWTAPNCPSNSDSTILPGPHPPAGPIWGPRAP